MNSMNGQSFSPLHHYIQAIPIHPASCEPSLNDSWFPNLSSCLSQFKSEVNPIKNKRTSKKNFSLKKTFTPPWFFVPKENHHEVCPIKRRQTPQKNFSSKKISTSSWFFAPNEDQLEECEKTVYTLLSNCTDDQARYIYKFFRDKTRNFVATGPFNRPSLICRKTAQEQTVLFVPKVLFEKISSTSQKSHLIRLINIKFSPSPDDHKGLLEQVYPIALKQVQRNVNPR